VQTAERVVYADSSALVKLVVREQWSTDLALFLSGAADRLASSALAEVEVLRAVRVAQVGVDGEEEALEMLASVALLDVDREILADARRLAGESLGTLDAIHLASAVRSGSAMLVTYDRQLGQAARELGMRVEAPGAA
jgi:predicted nucleic acid-binding protein